METTLWPSAHKSIEQHLTAMGQMSATALCLKDPADTWNECISVQVKVSKSFFVSVLQWIKDALIEKHLFMISGTNCD